MPYPNNYEPFVLIDDTILDEVDDEMQQLTDAINALPTQIKADMIDINFGNLQIINNQLLIWDQSGNLIVTYNLYDYNDTPTTTGAIFRRERV